MTNPIPGAESERELPPLPEPGGYDLNAEYGAAPTLFTAVQMAAYVRADRAAAKVGAAAEREAFDTLTVMNIAAAFPSLARSLNLDEVIGFGQACAETALSRAAKVGANVAADASERLKDLEEVLLTISMTTTDQYTAEFARNNLAAGTSAIATQTVRDFLDSTLGIKEQQKVFRQRFMEFLAAVAPAETPKPVARMERFPKDQDASKLLGCLRPAWLGSTPAEGTLLYAAPIAGDVEKDVARYRWLLEHYATGDGYKHIDDALNYGEPEKLSAAIDSELAGAMLAVTSPGEA